MKVVVKRYGKLRPSQDEFGPSCGAQIECPPRTKVSALLDLLGLLDPNSCIIAVEHRMGRAEDGVIDGATLNVIQIVSGGYAKVFLNSDKNIERMFAL
jgi:sulfur carrier protein ThiS